MLHLFLQFGLAHSTITHDKCLDITYVSCINIYIFQGNGSILIFCT
jgi:hypothetical protein